MKLKIEVNMDNAAFQDPREIERILAAAGDRLRGMTAGEFLIRDANGNCVGSARLERGEK